MVSQNSAETNDCWCRHKQNIGIWNIGFSCEIFTWNWILYHSYRIMVWKATVKFQGFESVSVSLFACLSVHPSVCMSNYLRGNTSATYDISMLTNVWAQIKFIFPRIMSTHKELIPSMFETIIHAPNQKHIPNYKSRAPVTWPCVST